jgi:hypothetical protein
MRIVSRGRAAVYSPAVLRRGRQTVMDRVARLTLVTLDSTAIQQPDERGRGRRVDLLTTGSAPAGRVTGK